MGRKLSKSTYMLHCSCHSSWGSCLHTKPLLFIHFGCCYVVIWGALIPGHCFSVLHCTSGVMVKAPVPSLQMWSQGKYTHIDTEWSGVCIEHWPYTHKPKKHCATCGRAEQRVLCLKGFGAQFKRKLKVLYQATLNKMVKVKYVWCSLTNERK